MLPPFSSSVRVIRVRMWLGYMEEGRRIRPGSIGRFAIQSNGRGAGDGAQSGAVGTKELKISKTNYSESGAVNHVHYGFFGSGGQPSSRQPSTSVFLFMYLENHNCQQPDIIFL
jgi:hypothetical protein